MGETDGPRGRIIGAGCPGVTSAKRLKDMGIAFDCFEMSDDIGGNWYVSNPNGAARHTIQVDFNPYVHALRREIEAGRRRAASIPPARARARA